MAESSIESAVKALEEKVAEADAFGATVKFAFDEGGAILMDGNAAPPAVAADEAAETEADCTISASAETFREMMDGDLDPTSAFMTGKIRIDGDMGAAMSVARLLG